MTDHATIETAELPPPARPRRNATWDLISSLALRFLSVVAGGATTVVLARGLGIHSYGTWAALSTAATLLIQLAEFGTSGPAVVRISAGEDSAVVCSTLLAWRLLLGTVFGVATAVGIAVAGTMPVLAAICLLVTVPFACVNVLAVPDQAAGSGRMQSLLPTVGALCSFGACGLAAIIHRGLVDTAVLYSIGAVVSLGITIAMTDKGWLRRAPSRAALGSLLQSSWPLAVMAIAVTAYYRLDSVLVYAISGSVQGALYGVSYRFLDVAQIIPAAVVTPMLAQLVPARNSREQRQQIVSRAARLLLSAAVVVSMVLVAFGRPLCIGLFGSGFAKAGLTTGVLSLAFLPISLGWLASTVATGASRTRPMAGWAWTVCVGSLALQVPAIIWLGANGAAIVTVITELAMGPVILIRTCRAENASLDRASIVKPMLCFAVAAAVLLLPINADLRGGIATLLLLALLGGTGSVRVSDLRLLAGSARDRLAT